MTDKGHLAGAKRQRQTMADVDDARTLALAVLSQHKKTGAFVAQLLDDRAVAQLPHGEVRFASEIVYGVVRRQATLDALIKPHVNRPRRQVEDALWTLLQIGTYQLVFMGSVPEHAAVHETVQLSKRMRKQRWSGFLNAVLRAIAGNLTDQTSDQPSATAVPIHGGVYRCCSDAVFPDPEQDPAAYLSRAFSYPSWIARRWLSRYPWDDSVRIAFWHNTVAKPYLRANRLRTTRDALREAIVAVDPDACDGTGTEAVQLSGTTRIEQLPGFTEGWFTVQDETAIQAGRLLSPKSGETVLDLCAGAGTKTTHLAEMMNNQGSIVAVDVHSERLAQLEQNCARLGITIVDSQQIHPEGTDVPEGPFDAILVDVPCSNTGVLNKRPEARWRIQPRDIQELKSLQKRLLHLASLRIKPGGRIVYSTCSTETEENQEVLWAALRKCPSLTLIQEIEHVPGHPSDGGYQALLVNHQS